MSTPRRPVANATVADIKEYYRSGEATTITDDLVAEVRVVAGPSSAEFADRLVLEDATGGITLWLDDGAARRTLPVGRYVLLKMRGLAVGGRGPNVRVGRGAYSPREALVPGLRPLSRELLRTHVLRGRRGSPPEPTAVAAHALRPSHASRLVRLCGVQLLRDSLRLHDCVGGGPVVRVRDSTVAIAPRASGRGCVTGVVSFREGEAELTPRGPEDFALDGPRCPPPVAAPPEAPTPTAPVERLREYFSGLREREPVELPGWSNYTRVPGGTRWEARAFEGNGYVQASAYGDTRDSVVAWLITPEIAAGSGRTLRFRTATAFHRHDGLAVLYATDYTVGSDPATATWHPLDVRLPGADSGDHTWVNSGATPLPPLGRAYRIGFRYRGSAKDGTTSTFRLDDILVDP